MKASKCCAFLFLAIIQLLLLSVIFYFVYLSLPISIQDTFQRSFIRQKILLLKFDRRFVHILSHKAHKTNSSEINDEVSPEQEDDLPFDQASASSNFDYNAILTEIPILRRSTHVHGFLLIIVQIIRTFYGLFHSTFYAIKSIIIVLYTSISSTNKYALYRSNGVNVILTKFVLKIITFLVKIFRFMTYWLRYLMKLGRIVIYRFFLHDDEPIYL